MRAAFLLIASLLVPSGCADHEARFSEIKSQSEGCYSAPRFPIIHISNDAISFGTATLSTDFDYHTFGRTPHTGVSIRPRLYLSKSATGAWRYAEDPRLRELEARQGKEYSAQWAMIPHGEEGQRIVLISPWEQDHELERVQCPPLDDKA